MDCIFILSGDLFGKHFTTRKKTRKRASEDGARNVYNYETDQVAIGQVIELMVLSHRTKTCDIEPEVVGRYDLQCQRDNA